MEKPIVSQELCQLGNVSGGLQPGAISFKTVDIQSDKMVTVKDGAQGAASIVVVELASRADSRLPMKEIEAAAMNPVSKVLALRAGQQLQIYNLDMKARVKSANMAEAVVFWRWISSSAMAIVTPTAVYHWSMEGPSEPAKVFDRAPELNDCPILAYRTDAENKWLALLAVGRAADGTFAGKAQLYSVEKSASKVIDGHQACFAELPGPDGRLCNVMCMASNSSQGGRLMVMELPTGAKQDTTFERKMLQVNFPNAQDFPVGMQISAKYKLLFMITRSGYLYLYDIITGTLLVTEQVSTAAVFTAVRSEKSGGIVCVNANGSVFQVSINDSVIVRYIQSTFGNNDLALRVAANAGLAGGEDLFKSKLREKLQTQDIEGAIRVVAEAPNNLLRTRETIQIFTQLGAQFPHIQPPPISTYYKQLLSVGKLNALESSEFAKIVLARGGNAYFKQLVDEDKIEGSEELGDILIGQDPEMALKMYFKGGCHVKVINVLVSRGDFSKVMAYCQRVNYTPDWKALLLNCIRTNPDVAVQMGSMIYQLPEHGGVDPNEVVENFLRGQFVRQLTLYLVDILKGNRPEDAPLQTKLLEINLKHSPPQVAEQIFSQNIISHFDALPIAQQCEKAHLFQRALENYNRAQIQNNYQVSQLKDMKRCIQNLQAINPEWLVEFFGNLSKDDSMELLGELMASNPRQNFKVCVQIAAKYYEMLGTTELIDLFLKHKSFEALYYFLGSILTFSTDPEVHYRYIEAAAKVGQIAEVERVTRESAYYEPERTKNLLKEMKLPDLWPLINVCDQHNYHGEMVKFLFDTSNTRYIELYVQKRNPSKTPFVIGALMDCNCPEDYIRTILSSVGSMCPAEALVEEVEKRSRLTFLTSWLEARMQEKSQETPVYNALAKIYVDQGKAQEFLEKNDMYDPKIVGKYCENRDPNLAFTAYRRGQCDKELVTVCTKNGMFKHLARYLVKRQDLPLWTEVLTESPNRKMLVDAVVQVALPETKVPEEVSTTVKAFMQADLPHELTVLLEKIVLHGSSEFKQNRYLQNLLILTAVKAAQDKVMDYVTRLDNYDAMDIANIASGAQLHEVAFAVYKKWNHQKEAMRVLIDDIKSVDRAAEFAEKANDQEVWSLLGRALLDADKITEAVDALVKAKDPNFTEKVANAADRTQKFNDLVKYLHMARVEAKQKDPKMDTQLLFALAKVGKYVELDEFVHATHTANLREVADRCYDEEMYDAARILYQAESNFPRLATTLCRLKNFHGAVEAAQKASNVRVWKEINAACIAVQEFKLAQICALAIVSHADEMEELLYYYESRGFYEEAINVLKAALGSQNAHMGIFTELGVLYAKYKPDRLMEHVKMFHKRLNVHKMITTCDQFHMWAEIRFLYHHNEEWDSAASCMMDHSVDAWEHEIFKEVLKNVGSLDLLYQAIKFYIQEHPDLVNDLLTSVSSRLDYERVVPEVRRLGEVALVKPFLVSVQSKNLKNVNESLNELYIEEEDYESLRTSVEHYHNLDMVALAQKLDRHANTEFRRTGAQLFRKNGKFKHAVEIQKRDKLYQDAMETAAESADLELIEDLLRWFVAQKLPECFCACLYACYEYIQPDVALELAWRYNMQDCAMPFLIQVMREYTDKIAALSTQLTDAHKTATEAHQAAQVATNQAPPVMISATPQGYDNSAQPNYGYQGGNYY
jgi:clathrin heavy chain